MNDCWLNIAQEDCCECPQLRDSNFDVKVLHWANNFEFEGWALHYGTLDAPGADSRLCWYGRCRVCGKRLCSDMTLATNETTDSFLAAICRWVYEVWNSRGRPLPEPCQTFREMVLTLFHEEDKPFITEWLARPENQNVMQL